MPAADLLGILNVGVLIPVEAPTTGGGYEFQQVVFTEIINRVALSSSDSNDFIRFIPVATQAHSVEQWRLNPDRVLSLSPGRFLRIRSALHRRLLRAIYPWNTLSWHETLVGKAAVKLLRNNIHVLWSLNPSIITDQIPFVLTVWDLQHRLQPFFPEVSRSGEWESRQNHFATTVRKAFLAVVGTQRGALELQGFLGSDQSRVLTNPFPCPSPVLLPKGEEEKTLRRLDLQRGRYLLYPAQFWTHKNHLAALLALRELIDQGHVFKLVFTGSDKGALASIMACIERLKLNQWVVNPGFVDRFCLAALYSGSFALIYPSYFGPDNIPPLEAMSYRVPACVANVPGCHEQYRDAVLRFDPNQPSQLVSCILRLLREEGLRERLIHSGSELVKQLTPAAYVDRIMDFFQENLLALRCASLLDHKESN